MLRLLLFMILTFTQCIAQKSKQNVSETCRPGSFEPDNCICSDPGKGGNLCISIFRCPKLFELYQRSKTLSSEEIKSLDDAFCGWSQGAPFVCCGTSPPSMSELHCGDSVLRSRSKVPGGKPAKLGAWPWMAALYYRGGRFKETSFMCGGSLISREWVLTAAHCVPEDNHPIKLIHVRLGDLNINDTVQVGATPIDVPIKEIIKHSNFSLKPVSNDIALLRLSKPVHYNENIRPICLHAGRTFQQNSTSYDRKKPFIAGWGAVEYGGEWSNHLLEAELNVIPFCKCRKNYERHIESKTIQIDATIVCAKGPDKDSCQGDSGGPLMIIDNNYWYQIGIDSAGILCNDQRYPGVYTKVASFVDWINEKTGLNF